MKDIHRKIVLSTTRILLLAIPILVLFAIKSPIHKSSPPAPVQVVETKPVAVTPEAVSTEPKIAKAVDIPVPFTVQAPDANWDHTAEESCEEAVVLMATWFAHGKTGLSQDGYTNRIPVQTAKDALTQSIEWEKDNLGLWESTTTEQTLKLLQDNGKVANAQLIKDITIKQIKQELTKGNIVLVPSAGQLLGNPYFTQPGPPYHYLVIRGYNNKGFITNDPGTKHGEGYQYKEDVLLNAVHDWTGSNDTITTGKKVAIIVSKI